MYPSRLCRCVSQLERRRPTAALLYNCHVHTRCTVTADQAVLVSTAADGQPAQEHQVASLSSASVYWKALLAPALWAGSQHPLTEQVCHADWLHCADDRGTAGAEPAGSQLDLPLETDLCDLDVRLCQTGWCWAGAARCAVSWTAGPCWPRPRRPTRRLPAAAASGRYGRCCSCRQLPPPRTAARCWWSSPSRPCSAGSRHCCSGCPWPLSWPAAEWLGAAATTPAARAAAAAAMDVPRPQGHSGTSRSARSHTTERNLPAVSPNTSAAAAVSPTPPAPPAAPTLAWLPALERLEVRLQISAVTVTVPAGPESGGGAAGDAERTADPLPAAAGHHPAPVPGRVRSSSDSGHRYCLHGQLVSVLPSVRLDSAALKSAALPTVPEVPVRLTRPSAAAAGSQLRSPSQTQQVMSPSVVVRDCASIPCPTPPPPHTARCCRARRRSFMALRRQSPAGGGDP
ncbi:uncharacterized protein LOC122388461 [Amphibalanus amphitrite]|uniref:uncharacterized protein LOC122388461 n=1 Tax=Amphibalanus amphitrite TaxID=1232801 RepID=UPI001C90B00A|nr:uncharacterized protein LOC122388461 [Amphibalanus amphitrite]XP_043235504.1 uncharacterized protein LOC122388461 [Amphibalanus amphitrite]XP_043235505.1 uncharacterized protein LOC122388461 [Amphibalanus amphitrite]